MQRARAQRAFSDTSDSFDRPRSAAILTVGLRKASQPLVLNKLKVRRAAFLCSEEACSVVEEILADAAVPSALKAEGATRRFTCDPDSYGDVRRAMEDAVGWLDMAQIPHNETILDVTGGTAVMSIGAYTVALDRGIDTMYVYSKYDSKRQPIAGTQRGVYVFRTQGAMESTSLEHGIET